MKSRRKTGEGPSADGYLLQAEFDVKFYTNAHPEIAEIDALQHYLVQGWKSGYDPNPGFSTNGYLARYADVRESKTNPFVHYLKFGRAEGRDPSGAQVVTSGLAEKELRDAFDENYYYANNPDVAAAGIDAFEHFMHYGWREQRDPSSSFSMSDYVSQHSDVKNAGENPWLHYMSHGRREGRKPKRCWALSDRAIDRHDEVARLPRRSRFIAPLVLIISDSQIEQCIVYRIDQKRKLLSKVGVRSARLKTSDLGLIKSYLPMATRVIIYRTPVSGELMDIIQECGLPVSFEFDDLVVGQHAICASGISESLSESQLSSLMIESEALDKTARACQELIVSTHSLARYYETRWAATSSRRKHAISVLPNFMLSEPATDVPEKMYDFGFCSPSKSIGPELKMVCGLIDGFSRKAERNVSVLVIGNIAAFHAVQNAGIAGITLSFSPFAEYSDYIRLLSGVRYGLIPLSSTLFNECKTLVRAYDCAAAGTLPVVSDVGEYRVLSECPEYPPMIVDTDGWQRRGELLAGEAAQYETRLAAFVSFMGGRYGDVAAVKRISEVLVK